MILPPYLKKGDTVAIVATARKISMLEIDFATRWLKKLGYQVLLGSTIGLEFHQFAGTDTERAQDFQAMIENPVVKAIWCARGGYGTVRIIDKINFESLKTHPKWIIGYSDITVLHAHLHNLNIATLHATMPIDIEHASAEAKLTLANALKGTLSTIDFKSDSANKLGHTSGIAIGGNLSVLYSLCGSCSAIETKGKILFLEDLDEYLYHVDRMLQNLDRNGMFKDLAGLVIGGMTKMHDNTIPFGFTVQELVLQLTESYEYPVAFNAPFGHITDNQTFVFGTEIDLNIQSERSIINYSK